MSHENYYQSTLWEICSSNNSNINKGSSSVMCHCQINCTPNSNTKSVQFDIGAHNAQYLSNKLEAIEKQLRDIANQVKQ